MIFKTSEEAIDACENGFNYSWSEFFNANKLYENPAKIIEVQKAIFRAGYMCGTKFVSSAIINKIQDNKKNK